MVPFLHIVVAYAFACRRRAAKTEGYGETGMNAAAVDLEFQTAIRLSCQPCEINNLFYG